jgi:hypothetical protein
MLASFDGGFCCKWGQSQDEGDDYPRSDIGAEWTSGIIPETPSKTTRIIRENSPFGVVMKTARTVGWRSFSW